MTMPIRKGRPDDAESLAAFAEHCFRDAFGQANAPEHMERYVAATYAPDIQARELADAAITTLVCTDAEGALVAYAQLRTGRPVPAGADPRALELWRFYVDRPYHGQGLAQQLMEAVLDAAAGMGHQGLWLAVWERNFRGRAFYQKLGFLEAGTVQFNLGGDVQTDRVMVFEFDR